MVSHPVLAGLADDELTAEIVGSRDPWRRSRCFAGVRLPLRRRRRLQLPRPTGDPRRRFRGGLHAASRPVSAAEDRTALGRVCVDDAGIDEFRWLVDHHLRLRCRVLSVVQDGTKRLFVDVCILSETNAWGGAEVHTVGLADVLVRRGHQVSTVALGDDVFRPKSAGGPAGRARPQADAGAADLPDGLSGVRGAGEESTRTCVLVRLGVQAGSLMLDLAARRCFGRYIAIEHTCAEMDCRTSRRHLFGLVPGLGLWWYKIWFLWQCRSMASSRVVCVSEAARRDRCPRLPPAPVQVLAVQNGIDADKFRPNDAHLRGLQEGVRPTGQWRSARLAGSARKRPRRRRFVVREALRPCGPNATCCWS